MKNKYILIGILLIFGIISCACDANKNAINSVPDLTVISKDSSEGINLYIDNIPEDTIYLFVSLYDITTNDRLYTGTYFKDNELEQIKKAGFLNCPFVKNGHEYEIIVTATILTEENIKTINSASITAVANGGIYIINNPTLIWNNSDNITTLSERPLFSDEKINSKNSELRYGLVFVAEEISGKVNDGANELTFDNTQIFISVIEMIKNNGLNEDISIFADVQISLEYRNKMVDNICPNREYNLFIIK